MLHILEELGLSENESQVYLSLLSLGKTSVLKLSKHCGVKRTTIYGVLDSLQKKGLLFAEMKGMKKYYVAEHPDRLTSMLEIKRQQLTKYLPEFVERYTLSGESSLLKVYEGIEGVKSAYEHLLKGLSLHDEYIAVGDHDTWIDLDPNFFSTINDRLVKKMTHVRLLLQRTEKSLKFIKNPITFDVKLFTSSRYITSGFIVAANKVFIYRHTQPSVMIVIENKSIVETYKEMFEVMWESVST